MSRQQGLVPVGQRSIVGKLIWLVIVVGLVVYVVQSPDEAAVAVRTGWNYFMDAVNAVVTFIRRLFG